MRRIEVFIGLDLGTSQFKGVAATKDGNILIAKKLPAPLTKTGKDGFEINPAGFYFTVCRLLRSLSAELPQKNYQIKALSMASASGNTLLTGKNGKPLTSALSWLDKRMAGKLSNKFKGFDTGSIHENCGWPFIEQFPLAHLAWLKENKKSAFEKAKMIAMTTEYAAFRLTGKWGLDTSSGTPFYLVDQKSGNYNAGLLSYLGFGTEKLPPVVKTGSILGRLTKKAARETGLRKEVLVVPGTFDHPACARGAGVLFSGQLLLSCGTSWVGFFPVKDRKKIIKLGMLADPFLSKKKTWGGMFSVPELGTLIDGAVKVIAGKSNYKKFDALSGMYEGKLKKNAKPDSWLEAINKIDREEGAFHIMKWSCLLMKEKISLLKKEGLKINSVYMAGGPSRSGIWPKVMAETLGVAVKCLNKEYTGAAGAALTASIGAGAFKDEFAAWKERKQNVTVFKPGLATGKKPFKTKAIDEAVYLKELIEFLPEKIIDIHTHIWLKKFEIKVKTEERGAAWPKLVAKDNSVEDLKTSYRLLFPGKNVIPAVFGMPEKTVSLEKTNNYAAQASKVDNLPGLLVTTPEWNAKELEKKIKAGNFIGIKPYLNFAPEHIESKNIEIFDFLPKEHLKVANKLGLVVILHIPRPGRLKDPINLQQLLEIENKYPRIKLVVAHLGRAYCEEDLGNALKVLSKTKNMSFDFCANTNAVVMEKFLRVFGAKRLVFGSDLPITRMRMRRITENGKYINLVPPGLYGDVSGDPSMREVSAGAGKKMTFFIYEEILSFKKAAEKVKLTPSEIEDVFYNNASRLLSIGTRHKAQGTRYK